MVVNLYKFNNYLLIFTIYMPILSTNKYYFHTFMYENYDYL